MQIYHSLEEFNKIENAVVTTGTFDGVHAGHRVILNQLTETAKKIKGESVVLTFFPHPRMVLFPEKKDLKLLNTIDEKIELLRKQKIDHLIIHPFSRQFSELSSNDFIRKILVKAIGAKTLILGYDHHFGKDREGSFKELVKLAPENGFELQEIPEQDINDVAVSSTRIRKALNTGNVEEAAQYLGYDYNLSGIVVKGKQLGRELGFPTANIHVPEEYKLSPGDGIYAVMVETGGARYKGMMSIGMNPTVHGKSRTLEVNILDFNKDIYGERIKVIFKAWMREELHFSDLGQLMDQLKKDEQHAIKLLSVAS